MTRIRGRPAAQRRLRTTRDEFATVRAERKRLDRGLEGLGRARDERWQSRVAHVVEPDMAVQPADRKRAAVRTEREREHLVGGVVRRYHAEPAGRLVPAVAIERHGAVARVADRED